MKNIVRKDDDEEVVLEDRISLKHFPPALRKLAKYLINSPEKVTIKQACKELKLNEASVHTLVWKARKKGNDFSKLISDISDSYLNMRLYEVDRALVAGAVSDSHADRKLYYQRIGKLSEAPVNTTNITLNMGFIPASSHEQDTREPGMIDVQPFIPKKS